ncbi:11510_t:CDS:1, partial [Funneliformis mosseae]
MDMDQHIAKYLVNHRHTNWSMSGILQDLSGKIDFINVDATNILNAFQQHLKNIFNSRNVFKRARTKASKLIQTLDLDELTLLLKGLQ